jgi:hypothetical protein
MSLTSPMARAASMNSRRSLNGIEIKRGKLKDES